MAFVVSIIEFVVEIGPRLAKCIFHNIESHYTSKAANLREKVQELHDVKQSTQVRVDEATRRGEEIHGEVQEWLTRAGDISGRAEDFLDNNRVRANIRCCTLQIPNLVSRRKLSRESKQMVEDLLREIQAGRGFHVVTSRPALHTYIAMRGDYKDFESRKTILEEIMMALRDRNVARIGVYGVGGIGKTTLAKEVARQAVEAKLFTEVAMTTVSQRPDPSRLQQDIAEKIGLDIVGIKSTTERADRLQRRLKEAKSILIIMDDIWEKLDLIEVGVHLENEGCKMLLTSRNRDVLGFMCTHPNIRIDDLRDIEAMNLFKTIVGDIDEQSDFMRLATDIVKECGRLPLAITVVALTLKNYRDPSFWRNALTQLQNSAPKIIDGMHEEVYASIRLSYDFLANDEEKSLLLLCSLFGEDRSISVEELLMCSLGWGLFPEIHTLADVRLSVKSFIDRLKARCLLLDGDEIGMVKMHDVIRDVALSIASNEGGMQSVILKKKEDCWNLKSNKLKHSKALSLLPYSDFNQLPERLECSELKLFLLLSDIFNRVPIPNFFLEESKDRLKSLFFQRVNLVPLPPSFHSLQNLQTLCLRDCALEDLNFVGDLKNLLILDLSQSTIKQLPVKVGQLSRLQRLNLEGCKDLELIEPNVISSLTQLEELHFAEEFDKWEVGEAIVSRRSNVNLAELENLQQLTCLSLRVPDAKTFPKDFKFSENLERYGISIGFTGIHLVPDGISRSLFLNLHERSQLTALGLESLMKKSECLDLSGLVDVKNFVYDLDSEGFCFLKHLALLFSNGVQCIVDCVDQIHPRKVFPVLERLRLWGLGNLERICHGKLPEDSFKNLREVKVWFCGKLKNLFPSCVVKRLRSVQVRDCEMMEEIVSHGGSEHDGAIDFPELRSLELSNLPKLVKFMSWSESEAAGGSSSVESCDLLFGEKIALSNLEDLYLYELGIKKLWPDQFPSTSYLQNLSSLRVENCHNLKYVSSIAAAKSCLIKLKELQVQSCNVLEEVLVLTDLQGEDVSLGKISLPQLNSLVLANLPNLKRFCKHLNDHRTLVTSSTSTEIIVDRSEHEEAEFDVQESLFNEMLEFPSLEKLQLSGLNAVESIWHFGTACYMDNLTSLSVESYNSLKYLFSFDTAERLEKLTELQVKNCELMEDVVVTRKWGEEERSGKILFPQLKSLELYKLPALRSFCQNKFGTACYMDNLTTLSVESCNSLKYLFSFDMAERLVKLTELQVENCEVMEDVVVTKKWGEEERSRKILFPQLKCLKLDKLPALKSFCQNKLEFPSLEKLQLSGLNAVESEWQFGTACYMDNLTTLSVESCNSLKYLFSFDMAERLVKLTELQVENCELMEDVVVTKKWGEEERSGKILFPQLKSLELYNLPALRSFCQNKVILPKLESLRTDWREGINVVLGTRQSSSTLSLRNQLKELELDFSNQDKPFALSICKLLHRCRNLGELQLNGLLVNVICKDQQHEVGAAQEYDGQLIPRLRELSLYDVPKLRRLFGDAENAQPASGALQSVKTLFVSFQNLTILEVSFCHRLTYLLAPSTATSLVQLKQMRVTDCNRMTEIIKDYREGEITEGKHDHEFAFPRLEMLALRHLPNLGSFFSGNNVIRFPKLEKLFVSKCPEMRTFSHGIIISSSMLNTIITELGSEWIWEDTCALMNFARALREHWDGDVNTTVRQLWEDDSNLALQQLFAEEDVHDSEEGASSQATRQ